MEDAVLAGAGPTTPPVKLSTFTQRSASGVASLVIRNEA